MATCPSINFGIPKDGAMEFSFQSGREILRCGTGAQDGCISLYITNVTLECNCVKHSCSDVTGAIQNEVCMQSVQAQWRDQNVVNWIAKDGVTSQLLNGSVITRAHCAGAQNQTSIYTHTEGSLSIRVLCNSSGLAGSAQSARDAGMTKFDNSTLKRLEWILSDVAVNLSPTAWQAGTITFQGFGQHDTGSKRTYRGNFSYENGRIEEASGELFYDVTPTPSLMGILINEMLANSCNTSEGCPS